MNGGLQSALEVFAEGGAPPARPKGGGLREPRLHHRGTRFSELALGSRSVILSRARTFTVLKLEALEHADALALNYWRHREPHNRHARNAGRGDVELALERSDTETLSHDALGMLAGLLGSSVEAQWELRGACSA